MDRKALNTFLKFREHSRVWGCSKRPMLKRAAISLRTVAEETSICSETSLEPTGSPVWVYTSMTAVRTRIFRSSICICHRLFSLVLDLALFLYDC